MKNDKQQLLIILLIVFISFVGTSIAYPIFPPLFLHPTNFSIIPIYWDKQMRSILLGVALAAYPLGQFIGSPILGGCSDRYGRKKMLMLSLIGSMIGYLFSALSLHLNCLWLLLTSRFLTGFMEGNLAIARAMATDLKNVNKYESLGKISAVSAIGYIVGPLLGGFLSDKNLVPWFSFAFPFVLAALFSGATIFLSSKNLIEKRFDVSSEMISIRQRFNLIGRFLVLFKRSKGLKYLLIISTIFTFSVDIFYEFGPVYLTGLWSMTPAGIALYNAILCITLAIGNGWLSHRLSLYFSANRILVMAVLITAMIFSLMVVWPSQWIAFVLFGLVGLSIGTSVTNLTIQISNAVDQSIQGEVMGTQLSLRMLGDALICLIGGFLIISSVILPIAMSSVIALTAMIVYFIRFFNVGK